MKYSQIKEAVELVKTSTGKVAVVDNVAEALINVNILKAELENIEKTLKSMIDIKSLPITCENGEIISTLLTQYKTDVKAIYDSGVIPEDKFWSAVKISESAFNKKDEEEKKYLAEVIKHKSVKSERESLRILKNEKIKDFDLENIILV